VLIWSCLRSANSVSLIIRLTPLARQMETMAPAARRRSAAAASRLPRGRRGHAPGGRAFEAGGGVLIKPGRCARAVPGALIGIDAGVGSIGQGAVRAVAFGW
jgi:hypothetical protein